MLVRLQRQVGRHRRDDGRDDISGDSAIGLDRGDDLRLRRIEQDFFLGLAQRGGDGVLSRIDAATGKSDLSRMGPQMLAADGQDEARFGAVGNGHQHGSRNGSAGAKLGLVALNRWFGRGLR
jgi:hypothetical protein